MSTIIYIIVFIISYFYHDYQNEKKYPNLFHDKDLWQKQRVESDLNAYRSTT